MDIRSRGKNLSASRTTVHSKEAGRCCEHPAQALQIKVPIVHQHIANNICLIVVGRFARSQDDKKAGTLLDELKQWSRYLVRFEDLFDFLGCWAQGIQGSSNAMEKNMKTRKSGCMRCVFLQGMISFSLKCSTVLTSQEMSNWIQTVYCICSSRDRSLYINF